MPKLHEWLEEECVDGDLKMIYETEDYLSAEFFEHCEGVPDTVTVVETECGLKIGGFSSTPWKGEHLMWGTSDAFLFVFRGKEGCFKAQLICDPDMAIYQNKNGPHFGADLSINEIGVHIQYTSSPKYEIPPLKDLSTCYRKPYCIKKIEVYKVSHDEELPKEDSPTAVSVKPATSFMPQINQALNTKLESLNEAMGQVERMEASLEENNSFVDALNDCDDIVKLNVSGTTMMAHRSTLCQVKDSVLASQFDDSKWTQQVTSAETWTPAEVARWVRNLNGVSDDVAGIFEKNEVTGVELINLGKDELYKLGLTRPGTVGILSNQINDLRKASEDSTTLVEHSPYCFGKILDYLRAKRLHSLNLIEEIHRPVIDDSRKKGFEKVVRYFFPGSQADDIL